LRVTYKIVVGLLAAAALLMLGYLAMGLFDGLRTLANWF